MSAEYIPYIIGSGINADEAPKIAATLHSWDDLAEWLDIRHPRNHHIPTDRITIGAPKFDTSWKDAVRRKFRENTNAGEKVGEAPGWIKVVEWRRRKSLFLGFILTSMIVMLADITYQSQNPNWYLRIGYDTLYAIMCFTMTTLLWKLIMGSYQAMRGHQKNPWHPSKTACNPGKDARVAILFPVYHEDAARVVAGMAAIWESLLRDAPEYTHHYDMFLISDSRDIGYWIAEQSALERVAHAHPEGRFYYRWRPNNANAKLGNMIDWCRRWGNEYKYMAVMDADSLMKGNAIHTMLRMMEGNSRLGILQTNPTPIMRKSIFGRMQQFSGRLYGSVFSYSLQSMYMGHANYIGHNAMIRTKPFIDHCMLPDLPGKTPWGGKPLSHDIVEAAMMARAGYEVWFLPEIEGSYEEIPANILGFVIRERRWMQGNLQHIRLLFVEGIHSLHRENFIVGIMGYASAPLWAIFLIITLYSGVSFMANGKINTSMTGALKVSSMMLFAASLIFLLLPRFMALVLNLQRNRCAQYGGRRKLITSILAETLFSLIWSPIIMVFISRFMYLWAKRKSISWGTQQRDDSPLTWSMCKRHFGWVTGVGMGITALMAYKIANISHGRSTLIYALSHHMLRPSGILFWFFPLLFGVTGCMFIAQVTSRTFPWVRKAGLFCIPEEINIPQEITDMVRWEEQLRANIPDPEDTDAAIDHALNDPHFYVRNTPNTRHKAHLAKRLLPKINSNTPLTTQEIGWAMRERACYHALKTRKS